MYKRWGKVGRRASARELKIKPTTSEHLRASWNKRARARESRGRRIEVMLERGMDSVDWVLEYRVA